MSAPLLLPHASMVATKIADLRNHHFRALPAAIKRLKLLSSKLHFISPSENDSRSLLSIVITVGAVTAPGDVKGWGGDIIFRRLGNLVHPIYWSSCQLFRLSRSSSAAEILAAADEMSSGLYMKAVSDDVSICQDLQLTVHQTALASMFTSIKEPQERPHKIDQAAIRETLDEGELGSVYWCPLQKLLAKVLVKDNKMTAKLLHIALVTGLHSRPGGTRTNLRPLHFWAYTGAFVHSSAFSIPCLQRGAGKLAVGCFISWFA